MDYSKDEIIDAFLERICLYKDGQVIYEVFVKSIKVDDMGVKFELVICNNKQATNFYGDLEYEEESDKLNTKLHFSGAWEITSFRDMRIHIAYVSAELNANPKSLQLFKNGELDFFKLWQRTK